MARFIVNRRMMLILALVACCAASPWFAPGVRAGNIGTAEPRKPGTGGTDQGDPDMPVGPSRSSSLGAAPRTASSMRLVRPVGDGTTAGSAWMWRVRIVLLSLRAYTLRF